MITLHEQELHINPSLLTAAWTGSDTVALLPKKTGTTVEWLSGALAMVPNELARHHFIMLTSGSTGLPKLVVGARERTESLVCVLHDVQESGPVAETIALLPLSYTYSFVNQWVWAHVMGRRFVPTTGLADPTALRAALGRAENAMLCLVGVQVPLLLSHFDGMKFPGVIRIHFAGGRFPQEQLGQLAVLFPNAHIFNNYGCAEAMPRLTVRRAEDACDSANIGFPIPGVELTTNDKDEVEFRSSYRAVGVVEQSRFRPIEPDEWIPSGDLGRPNPDGSWTLLGRTSEVFKRHGEKVSLAALLTTVSTVWPGQCVLYRASDPTGEEGCVLVIAPTSTLADVGPVLMALRKNHPRAHWPLRIESVPSLPLLSNGKPDVRALSSTTMKSVLWKQHL